MSYQEWTEEERASDTRPYERLAPEGWVIDLIHHFQDGRVAERYPLKTLHTRETAAAHLITLAQVGAWNPHLSCEIRRATEQEAALFPLWPEYLGREGER